MAGKQAKTLSADHIDDSLVFRRTLSASGSQPPDCSALGQGRPSRRRNRQTDLGMVLGAGGEIGTVIELQDHAAKKGSGRSIPLHAELRQALLVVRQSSTGLGPVIRSERGGPMTPLSIVVWFGRVYDALGFDGCSSHSGRRTFITRAARAVHKAGGSLRDVQLLAGHRSIQTTQRYIDGDSDAQRRLISLI